MVSQQRPTTACLLLSLRAKSGTPSLLPYLLSPLPTPCASRASDPSQVPAVQSFPELPASLQTRPYPHVPSSQAPYGPALSPPPPHPSRLSSPCPGPTVEPECPRPLLRLEGCLWGRLSLLAPRPSTEGYPQPTLAPLYFSPAPLAPNWASRTVTFRDHPASPATHTGNSPRDHDGHTAPGPTVVWLRAWPQRKGWKALHQTQRRPERPLPNPQCP